MPQRIFDIFENVGDEVTSPPLGVFLRAWRPVRAGPVFAFETKSRRNVNLGNRVILSFSLNDRYEGRYAPGTRSGTETVIAFGLTWLT
jgi:hypothetical protein